MRAARRVQQRVPVAPGPGACYVVGDTNLRSIRNTAPNASTVFG